LSNFKIKKQMIKRLIHFSDLHIRLFKDHDQYRGILESALKEWKSLQPDRIVFTGDLVHSKNQMTPELVEFVAWILSECAKITKTIVIIGNHTDVGYKFEEGFDTNKFKGCDLVLCGDIHKRQVFDIPGDKKAYMIGSTIQQNFGETVRKHGYGIYEVEKDEYTFIDLPNPKPFLSFYINSFDCLTEGSEKLVNY